MYCSACGQQSAEGALFCSKCGSPLGIEAKDQPTVVRQDPVPGPPPQPGVVQYYPPPPPPPRPPLPEYSPPPPERNQKRVWIALAIVGAVLIVIALAVPIVLAYRGGEEEVAESTTTTSAETTTTEAEPQKTTTTVEEEPSSTTSSSTPVAPGSPGDSSGEWVEAKVPDVMAQGTAVALSDEVLAVQVQTASGPGIRAKLFSTGETFELPMDADDVGGIDVEGSTVVWWEGAYDEATSSYSSQHVYEYSLPEGPKIEIAGGEGSFGYPQIAGSWVTWTEGVPWEPSPDEYWLMPIFGNMLDSGGSPVGEPTSLVPSAVASILGDATWTYSLSPTFLAWEQNAEADGFATGTHVLDLDTMATQPVGDGAWRPSLSGNTLVFWEDGLVGLDLTSGERWDIDAQGDFATAAPTFAAYFRPAPAGGGYEIAARGYTGSYEQVLTAQTTAPPWLSAFIAVSSTRVAFSDGDKTRLFEWLPK